MPISYNLVHTASNEVKSQSWEPVGKVKAGFHVVETVHQKRSLEGTWNKDTSSYDPIIPHNRITLEQFMYLLLKEEREALYLRAKTSSQAAEFIETLKIIRIVDLDKKYIKDRVNLMESVGVLGAGRAAVILNG